MQRGDAGTLAAALRERSWLGVWVVLLATPLLVRGPLPPDELRYLSVAWEMWSRGDWLVPHLNGAPYGEKPPLLFWIIHAGWAVFGVNGWWPRALPAMCALASISLTQAVCKDLWSHDSVARGSIPWLLLGSFGWVFYTQVVMFDLLLTVWVLCAWLGLRRAERGEAWGWVLVVASTALGTLTKGPIALLYVAGPGLLAPWWARASDFAPARWYRAFVPAVLAGGTVALLWALLAARSGGGAYAADMLVNQTAGRVVDSFAHARPFWFYAAITPVLLFPWSLWPPAWRHARTALTAVRTRREYRFLGAAVIPGTLVLSVLSGKQPHYLLPLVPPLVLMLAAAASDHASSRVRTVAPTSAAAVVGATIALVSLTPWVEMLDVGVWSPGWGLSAAFLSLMLGFGGRWSSAVARLAMLAPLLILSFETAFFSANREAYDTTAAAAIIARLQREGRPIAHAGDYEGEFHFPGRLWHPLAIIDDDERAVGDWLDSHPRGYVVRRLETPPTSALYVQRFRGLWLALQGSAQDERS
jgi:4-amino-4-deoxy-L-arabinose transferase-like glycosyltransferase